MSAYFDVIQAEPSLLNHWPLRDETDAKGSVTLTFGPAIRRLERGRAENDPAIKFQSAQDANSFVEGQPASYSGAHTIEVLLKFANQNPLHFPTLYSTDGDAGGLSMRDTASDPTNPVAIRLSIGNANGVFTTPYYGSAAIFPLDVWHHCVFAVGADGSYQIFANGVSIATGIWDKAGVPKLFPGGPIRLGNPLIVSTLLYNGYMQHFAAYTTKFNLAKAQAHYAALGSEPASLYRVSNLAYSSRTRVRVFDIATLTKSLPRTLAVAEGGVSRAGRGGGGFEFPLGTVLKIPNPLVGGVARPGRMVGAPPGEFALPASIAPKVVNLGAGGGEVTRPLEGQIWPR